MSAARAGVRCTAVGRSAAVVLETRGHVIEGKVAHFQVTLKVGFRLES